MKIVVDWDLCEANAVCMQECPEVFEVDANDELLILDERPPDALRQKVEAAVQGCPRQALRLED